MTTSYAHTLTQLRAFWDSYGAELTLAGLVMAAGLLVTSFLVARHQERTQPWLANLTNLAVLALSAEGMWVIATERLGIPDAIALGVFFIGEALLVNSALLARAHHDEHGHTGRHGIAVWAIAAISGAIVATNAASLTEFLLRLALPLAAAWMWQSGYPAADDAERSGKWRWTPRRLLIHVGAISVEDQDVEQINREHTVRKMTRLARLVHHEKHPERHRAGVRVRKLERMALQADDEMLAEVQRRVRRAARAAVLTNPHQPAGGAIESANGFTVRFADQSANQSSNTGAGESANGSRTTVTNGATNGSRTTAREYAEQAAAAYMARPGEIDLSSTAAGAWVMKATGCAKSTAYSKVLPLVRELVEQKSTNASPGQSTDEFMTEFSDESANAGSAGSRTGARTGLQLVGANSAGDDQ